MKPLQWFPWPGAHLDQSQFDPLWMDFAHDFIPYARKRVGDEDADDAMLEAYIRARRLLPKYRHVCRRAFFGWAVQILSRVCSEIRRDQQRHYHTNPVTGNGDLDTLDESSDFRDSVASVVDRDRAAAIVWQVVGEARLSDLQRAAVESRLRDEPTAETARRLGIAENNVRAHLSCAMAIIRASTGVNLLREYYSFL